jgi:RHS repeat-associated protein
LTALQIKDGSLALAQYSYLGGGTFVVNDYTEPDIKWTLADLSGTNDPDTGDIYSGFDRFGRVKDNRWYNYGSATDTDRIKYGYDRNGNRTYRENTVATAAGAKFDEQYLYDLIDRLKHMDRGQLTALKDSITNKTFAQCWQLDATGNWRNFREDDNGDGTWDLNQQRANNPVNEITDISETAGPSWVTPAYNRAGNMTTIPKPADPTVAYTGIYDAWNRLVATKEASDYVTQYEYDGAKRRTVQKTYTAGALTETRHLYYTEPSKWQVIEERLDSSTTADRQFVWGLRYIDELVLRDRDNDANGSLDERLYAMQDANWNVTALTSASGTVQERYAYTAYGVPIFLDAAFASRGSSSYQWETLFAGYRWDEAIRHFQIRHRIFSPMVGTWLQRDPIKNSAGPNLYQYVGSHPISYGDPQGLRRCKCYGLSSDPFCWVLLHDCFGNAITCFCALFDVASTVTAIVNAYLTVFFPAAVGAVALTALVIGMIDCLCDAIGGFAISCCSPKGGHFTLLNTITNCALTILSSPALSGVSLSQAWNAALAIISSITSPIGGIAEWLETTLVGGLTIPPATCGLIMGGCRKGIDLSTKSCCTGIYTI